MHLSSSPNRRFALGILPLQPLVAVAESPASPTSQSSGTWEFLQFTWDSGSGFGWQNIGTSLLVAMALSYVLLLPCARMIAGPKQLFARSILFVGSALALTAAFVALAAFVSLSESLVLLAALGVVYVAILFSQTRHLFAVSRAAAAGLLGCYLVATGGALFGTEQLMGRMPWTAYFSKPREEQSKLFVAWQGGKSATKPATAKVQNPNPSSAAGASVAVNPAPTPVAPATPPPAPIPLQNKGGPDLQALYAQLQKARAELNPNDAEAVARFNQQAAAYHQEKAMASAISTRETTVPTVRAEQIGAGTKVSK